MTLLNIYSSKASKSGTSRIVMVFAILLLYVRFGFIDNDKDVMTVFARLTGFNSRWTVAQIADGVTSIIGTIIADGTMIWRCFVVWGGRWFIVLIPILSNR